MDRCECVNVCVTVHVLLRAYLCKCTSVLYAFWTNMFVSAQVVYMCAHHFHVDANAEYPFALCNLNWRAAFAIFAMEWTEVGFLLVWAQNKLGTTNRYPGAAAGYLTYSYTALKLQYILIQLSVPLADLFLHSIYKCQNRNRLHFLSKLMFC